VTLDMKLDALPDVLSDLLSGYMAIGWSGLVAPKNVPADIVALLHKHGSDALAQPNIRQRVIDMGGLVPGGTAADFGQFMAEDTERSLMSRRALNCSSRGAGGQGWCSGVGAKIDNSDRHNGA
jgi:tripartite-type tricarboxylate transporter receptor subunit TctC